MLAGVQKVNHSLFENVGIQRKNIVRKIIQGARSRAETIVESAREENCDTLFLAEKENLMLQVLILAVYPGKLFMEQKK